MKYNLKSTSNVRPIHISQQSARRRIALVPPTRDFLMRLMSRPIAPPTRDCLMRSIRARCCVVHSAYAPVRAFWDIDNLRPQQADKQAVAEALAAMAKEKARGRAVALDAIGNDRSWNRLGLRAAVEAAGFRTHLAATTWQAADLVIDSMARDWLTEGEGAAESKILLLASGDRGFEALLHAARKAGAFTVVVANTRWSAHADERLPWTHMHTSWEPRGWRLSKWYRELEKNGGRERLSSMYRSRDGHHNPHDA